ncbi:MAG: hypothetical protein P4L53_06790 [Candidatus Obscuribacterales bacterium]|nr:hypothetical protein [Candidatus Obscuribacterales bacterium]
MLAYVKLKLNEFLTFLEKKFGVRTQEQAPSNIENYHDYLLSFCENELDSIKSQHLQIRLASAKEVADLKKVEFPLDRARKSLAEWQKRDDEARHTGGDYELIQECRERISFFESECLAAESNFQAANIEFRARYAGVHAQLAALDALKRRNELLSHKITLVKADELIRRSLLMKKLHEARKAREEIGTMIAIETLTIDEKVRIFSQTNLIFAQEIEAMETEFP